MTAFRGASSARGVGAPLPASALCHGFVGAAGRLRNMEGFCRLGLETATCRLALKSSFLRTASSRNAANRKRSTHRPRLTDRVSPDGCCHDTAPKTNVLTSLVLAEVYVLGELCLVKIDLGIEAALLVDGASQSTRSRVNGTPGCNACLAVDLGSHLIYITLAEGLDLSTL